MNTAQRAIRLPVGAIAFAIAAGAAASAQSGSGYVPPKLLARGTTSSAIAGSGTVELSVFVKPDGSGHVQRIIHSSNPADNGAASEIANSSKYVPARRSGKPVIAFYTYKITFDGSGTIANASSGGPLEHYEAMIRRGNYAGAKSGLTSYLANAPSDARANMLLGIADSYSDDPSGGAQAFDRAGSIPPAYRAVAATTYRDAATQAYTKGDYDASIADARKSIAILPSPSAYATIGNAEFQQKNYSAAATDLQQALSSLPANVPAHSKAILEGNLASAYLSAGDADRGLPLAKDATTLDPTLSTSVSNSVANYYIQKASAQQKAGNLAASAATLEAAAAAVPKQAVRLYAQAASDYAAPPKPDYAHAKTDAEKALAIAPDDAFANFIDGIILLNQNNRQDGLTHLKRADASAKAANDSDLTAQIETALKNAGTQ